MAKPNLSGKWTFDHGDGNAENYAKAAGVPADRIATTKGSAALDIKQDGGVFDIKARMPGRPELEMKFTAGESHEITRSNGQKVKVNTKWDGDTLVSTYDTDSPMENTWTLEGKYLVQVMNINHVSTKMFYVKE